MQELPVDPTVFSLADEAPSPQERRDGERHLTLFRVGTLTVGDRRELCLIKNISAGGMRIRPYCDLESDQAVAIELKTGMVVPGKVTWLRDDNAGISFDHPVDVIDVLSASADGPRPRMPRIEVACPASLREGARVYRVTVGDISQGGVKLSGVDDLPVNGDIILSLPGLEPVQGVVRWSSAGTSGITFNGLLPLTELVRWLRDRRDELKAA